jgi:hypothetical protein
MKPVNANTIAWKKSCAPCVLLRLRWPDKVAQFGSVLAEGGETSTPPSGDAVPA